VRGAAGLDDIMEAPPSVGRDLLVGHGTFEAANETPLVSSLRRTEGAFQAIRLPAAPRSQDICDDRIDRMERRGPEWSGRADTIGGAADDGRLPRETPGPAQVVVCHG
jgi:hypothetical protein